MNGSTTVLVADHPKIDMVLLPTGEAMIVDVMTALAALTSGALRAEEMNHDEMIDELAK